MALYVLADLILIPLSIIPIGGQTVQSLFFKDIMQPLVGTQAASLAWALLFVLIVWGFGYYLYKKKIYIKL